MHICSNCKERLSPDGATDPSRPFPTFAVAGGVLGGLAAAVTGALVIVPAAVIAGVLADHSTCDACGGKTSSGDECYRVMEEISDELGATSLRTLGASRRGATGASPRIRPEARPQRDTISWSGSQSLMDHPGEKRPEEPRYTFDEARGLLVPDEGDWVEYDNSDSGPVEGPSEFDGPILSVDDEPSPADFDFLSTPEETVLYDHDILDLGTFDEPWEGLEP